MSGKGFSKSGRSHGDRGGSIRPLPRRVHEMLQRVAIEKSDAAILELVKHRPEQEAALRILGSAWARLRYKDLVETFQNSSADSYEAAFRDLSAADEKSDDFHSVILAFVDKRVECGSMILDSIHREIALQRQQEFEQCLKSYELPRLVNKDALQILIKSDRLWFQLTGEDSIEVGIANSDRLRTCILEALDDAREAEGTVDRVVKGGSRERGHWN